MQNTTLSLLPVSGVPLPFHPLPLPLQIFPSRALLLPTSSSSFSQSFLLPAREQDSGSQNSTLCHSQLLRVACLTSSMNFHVMVCLLHSQLSGIKLYLLSPLVPYTIPDNSKEFVSNLNKVDKN